MLNYRERAEKQLLTVNPVNPSCSSALDISSRQSIPYFLSPKENRRGSSSECLLHYNPNDIYPLR